MRRHALLVALLLLLLVLACCCIKSSKHQLIVSANPSNGGLVSGGGKYPDECQITVVATPNQGWQFVNWTENAIEQSTYSVYDFVITKDRELIANFAESFHELILSTNHENGGNVSGGGLFEHGSEVTVLATPNEGWRFMYWTEDLSKVDESESYSFLITEDRELTAHFAREFTITLSWNGNGSVNTSDSLEMFNDSEDFRFSSYEDLKGIWDGTMKWGIKEDRGFVISIEMQNEGKFGGIAAVDNGPHDIALKGSVNEDGDVEFSFTVESSLPGVEDYLFSFDGTVEETSISGNYTVREGRDLYKQGTFEMEKRYSEQVLVELGEDITFDIIPGSDWYTDEVIVDWLSAGTLTEYTFENVERNHYLHVEFKPVTHTITSGAEAGGRIVPSGDIEVVQGSNQVFNIFADEGYAIEDVEVDGLSIGPVAIYEFENVTAGHTIFARFIKTYTITASAGVGGTITPSGEVTVFQGWGQSFAISPSKGYAIQDVVVDGSSVGKVDSYIFYHVMANHTIHASFQEVLPPGMWQRSLGGTKNDSSNEICQTYDGGFIILGHTHSNDIDVSGNHGNGDAWIAKVNPNGWLSWQNCIGGSNLDYGRSIKEVSDGNFILCGNTFSSSINSNDFEQEAVNYGDAWIAKINKTGGIIWKKILGGNNGDIFRSIIQTVDGGFAVLGDTSSSDGDIAYNNGGSDLWIVKLDETGEIEWQECLGGSGDEYGNSIHQTADGGYLLCGQTDSDDGDVSGTHDTYYGDMWIVKLSSNGTIEWQKALGGSMEDSAYSGMQTSDGGYIVAGMTGSDDGDVSGYHGYGDVWILKLDQTGSIEWENALGGTDTEAALSVFQSADGGYVVAGSTKSADGDVSGHKAGFDVWLIKLSTLGKIIWEGCLGGTSDDYGTSVIQTDDNDYVVLGYSNSDDGNLTENNGGYDLWIVKLMGE